MIPAAGTYERVLVVAGWKPEPPLYGAGQVIRIFYEGVEQTATVTGPSVVGNGEIEWVGLYLPESDRHVRVELIAKLADDA